jgi:hypothetical protein
MLFSYMLVGNSESATTTNAGELLQYNAGRIFQ